MIRKILKMDFFRREDLNVEIEDECRNFVKISDIENVCIENRKLLIQLKNGECEEKFLPICTVPKSADKKWKLKRFVNFFIRFFLVFSEEKRWKNCEIKHIMRGLSKC